MIKRSWVYILHEADLFFLSILGIAFSYFWPFFAEVKITDFHLKKRYPADKEDKDRKTCQGLD